MTNKQKEYIEMLTLYGHFNYLEDDDIEMLVKTCPKYFKFIPYEGDEDYEFEVKFIGKCPFKI